MELPQPHPYGTQGRKPTHNFLSLYSPAQQDPSSTPGSYLETHDFLQPLEQRVGKNVVKEGTAVEHILPGGIGTYSISHVACQSQTQSQRMARPEGVVITAAQSSGSDKNDENSNCSSYSGFSLWEESAVTKGKTGKENIIAGSRRSVIREGGMKMGGVPWMTSASSSAHNRQTTTISSLSSSRPLPAQRNASFGDMLNSAKGSQEDEDDEIGEFVIKKEPSSHYNDTAHHDQKPNTPRSKHSATEQRRRSKINDRFSMLRELIPHGDQKRDKASFLLEVIEYIQFLQEKVHKYEDSWNNNSNQRPTEGFIEQPRVQPVMSDPPLITKTHRPVNHPKKGQILSDSDLTPRDQIGQHARSTNKGSPFPSPLLQSHIHSSESAPLPSTLAAESSSQLWQTKSLKDQEVSIESGTISISTIYSQGLLSTLTQTLQNAGVDLSQANISVQIDLGKRANPSTTTLKKNEVCGMDETMARARLASAREEKSEPPALKRFKTNRN